MNLELNKIISELSESLKSNIFIKLNIVNYQGDEIDLKAIYIKKILVKKEEKLSFTYRYKTKDIVKNYSLEETLPILENHIQINGFHHITLFTIDHDLTLELIKGKWSIKKKPPTILLLPSFDHDIQKKRKIESTDKKYLQELRITDSEGKVYNATQDKYKQINHYVEILSSLLKELPDRDITNVVDMGAGKGYLTFALYDYLNNVLHKPSKVIGVEYRKDLVEICNEIAVKSNFKDLNFVEGSIEKYENKDINVLIALHACDTATDDAIYKGITNNADLIVVAPCCHKQIRKEIEKNKAKNELDFLTKYGIFLERQAEMVTDGIRALILNYYGYSTKVIEFISDAHTPKNVLIVGIKKQSKSIDKESILEKIKSIKSYFGIDYHHLEKQMNIDSRVSINL